jgi:hypothetical protein
VTIEHESLPWVSLSKVGLIPPYGLEVGFADFKQGSKLLGRRIFQAQVNRIHQEIVAASQSKRRFCVLALLTEMKYPVQTHGHLCHQELRTRVNIGGGKGEGKRVKFTHGKDSCRIVTLVS